LGDQVVPSGGGDRRASNMAGVKYPTKGKARVLSQRFRLSGKPSADLTLMSKGKRRNSGARRKAKEFVVKDW